ncbi:MAG: HEPN domain-containing protein [Nitrososphaerales archaeon]
MLDETEYLRWIISSKRTLNSARGDLDRGDYNWVCFKAQQSAELSIKALLHGLGMPAYGNSISRLLTMIPKDLKIQKDIIQASKTLDKYYVPTRYPNAWTEGSPEEYYTKEDAEKSILLAEAIIGFVEESWKLLKREGK